MFYAAADKQNACIDISKERTHNSLRASKKLPILILNRVLSVTRWDIAAAAHNKFEPRTEINNIRKIPRPKKVKIKLPKRGEEYFKGVPKNSSLIGSVHSSFALCKAGFGFGSAD